MYKATLSFTATNYDIRKNQIIDDNFIEKAGITEAEINEYLSTGYLVEYDGTLEITQNGLYDVEQYQQADVDVPSETPTLQEKSVTITTNTTEVVEPETGYDALSKVTVTTNIPQPSGTIDITDNGTVDVRDYASANVNVSSGGENNAQINTYLSGSANENVSAYIVSVPTFTNTKTKLTGFFSYCSQLQSVELFDTSEVTRMDNMFTGCSKLETVPQFNTHSVTTTQGMFSSCSKLKSVPLFDFSSNTTIASMFSGCNNLITVPQLNTSLVADMMTAFRNCYRLSDESLNNILGMCINATNISSAYRTLAYIGLSSTQATTCQTLSNWNDFVSAGWSTGY